MVVGEGAALIGVEFGGQAAGGTPFLDPYSSEVSLPERFGRRQGYAFVTFDKAADVDKAVAEVNGKELLGREMRVQKATSGGPYTSENGEHGETASGEAEKVTTETPS